MVHAKPRRALILILALALGAGLAPLHAQEGETASDFVIGLNAFNTQIKDSLANQPTRRVTIVPFVGTDTEFPTVSAFIVDQLITALVAGGDYTIVDNEALVDLVNQNNISPLELASQEEFNLLRGQYANTSIIVGSITDLGSKVAVMARIINAESGMFTGGAMVYLKVADEFAALVNRDRPAQETRPAQQDQRIEQQPREQMPVESKTETDTAEETSREQEPEPETRPEPRRKPAVIPDLSQAGDAEIYKEGRDQYENNNFQAAITVFEQLVDRYPDSPYADNAVYWIGESHYSMKNWQKAREQFQRVLDTYPYGNKVPDATFKRGFAEEKLGNLDKAIFSMEEVIRRFGNTDIARRAKAKLQQLQAVKQQA